MSDPAIKILGDLQRQVAALTQTEIASYSSGVWTPTLGGFSANPTGLYRYITIGKLVIASVYQTADGTSNSTSFSISAPFTAATITGMHWQAAITFYINGGVQSASVGMVEINSGSSQFDLYRDSAGSSWSNTLGKRVGFTIMYQMA